MSAEKSKVYFGLVGNMRMNIGASSLPQTTTITSMPCLIDGILDCLCMGRSNHYDVLEGQPALDEKKQHPQTTESLAADIVSTLCAAATNDELNLCIQDVARETGWYESLVVAVFICLENALKVAPPVGQTMKDAYEKAAQAIKDVFGFAKEHPVFCTLVALGVLVLLMPWAIEVLGFGALGPVEGSFAAAWQARYAGYVPKGSLFSFLQRLGMKWVASPAMVARVQ